MSFRPKEKSCAQDRLSICLAHVLCKAQKIPLSPQRSCLPSLARNDIKLYGFFAAMSFRPKEKSSARDESTVYLNARQAHVEDFSLRFEMTSLFIIFYVELQFLCVHHYKSR